MKLSLEGLKTLLQNGEEIPDDLSEEESAELWAEVKPVWIEALESGRYKQGQGYLKTGAGHCCLGVLADIVHPNGWDAPTSESDVGSTYHDHTLNCGGILVSSLWSDALGDPIEQGALTGPNDNGEDFAHIADIIRKA